MKKSAWEAALVVVGVLALVFAIYKTFFLNKKKILPTYPPQFQQIDNTPKVTVPTKTPKEIEIISKIETQQVEVFQAEAKPQMLTVKRYDQVKFVNKADKTIKVKGSNWGNISLKPNENMTQPFNTVGRYSYEVIGLDNRLLGEVVVK